MEDFTLCNELSITQKIKFTEQKRIKLFKITCKCIYAFLLLSSLPLIMSHEDEENITDHFVKEATNKKKRKNLCLSLQPNHKSYQVNHHLVFPLRGDTHKSSSVHILSFSRTSFSFSFWMKRFPSVSYQLKTCLARSTSESGVTSFLLHENKTGKHTNIHLVGIG